MTCISSRLLCFCLLHVPAPDPKRCKDQAQNSCRKRQYGKQHDIACISRLHCMPPDRSPGLSAALGVSACRRRRRKLHCEIHLQSCQRVLILIALSFSLEMHTKRNLAGFPSCERIQIKMIFQGICRLMKALTEQFGPDKFVMHLHDTRGLALANSLAAMQLDEEIETGKTLDLSAQDNLTGLADGPQATTYTWYAEDGTTLVAGTDYTEDGGKFTFLKAQSQPVYCTMETAAFPSFSGANAFRTTAISVKGGDGVESTATATIAIRGGKGTITTDNLPAGSRVEVYDLSGRKVAGQDSAEGRATFSVKPGLYIVSVNGTARKVNAF